MTTSENTIAHDYDLLQNCSFIEYKVFDFINEYDMSIDKYNYFNKLINIHRNDPSLYNIKYHLLEMITIISRNLNYNILKRNIITFFEIWNEKKYNKIFIDLSSIYYHYYHVNAIIFLCSLKQNQNIIYEQKDILKIIINNTKINENNQIY